MQNRLDDFGALIQILRLPYLENRSTFRKKLVESQQDTKLNLENLRCLLAAVCLRRCRSILQLPEPAYVEQRLRMSLEESRLYKETLNACKRKIQRAKQGNAHSQLRKSTLELYLRTRMACNNGTYERFIPSFVQDSVDQVGSDELYESDKDHNCPACFIDTSTLGTPSSNGARACARCSARMCEQCLPEYTLSMSDETHKTRRKCGFCHNSFTALPFSASLARYGLLSDAELNSGVSTKLNKVLEDIERHKHGCNRLVISDADSLLR